MTATLAIDRVGHGLRRTIRSLAFDLGLSVYEEPGFLAGRMRIRGDEAGVRTVDLAIKGLRDRAARAETRALRALNARDARTTFRRTGRLQWAKRLVGRGSSAAPLTRRECEDAFELVVEAEDDCPGTGAEIRARLSIISGAMGDLVLDDVADDGTLSTMAKINLATIRAMLRNGDLRVADDLRRRLVAVGGDRRLPDIV